MALSLQNGWIDLPIKVYLLAKHGQNCFVSKNLLSTFLSYVIILIILYLTLRLLQVSADNLHKVLGSDNGSRGWQARVLVPEPV